MGWDLLFFGIQLVLRHNPIGLTLVLGNIRGSRMNGKLELRVRLFA